MDNIFTAYMKARHSKYAFRLCWCGKVSEQGELACSEVVTDR